MEITITVHNAHNYLSGTFPGVTELEWCVNGRLNRDILTRFPNVIEFDCVKNQLTSLQDIEGLMSLRKLYCYNNQLISLQSISELTNLQELDCSGNQLTSLQGISRLTNLQKLNCGFNKLTSLQDVSGLMNLRKLYCDRNRFTSLQDINMLTNLQILSCGHNQLTSLRDIGGLTNLQELYCECNQLTSLVGIGGLVDLQKLWCSYNQLSSLQGISGLTNLQTLYCGNNQIISLDPVIYLRRLRVFLHQANPIENPSIQVRRFLSRFDRRHITGSSRIIYDDGQNVHDITIQVSTRDSLTRLMQDSINEFDITDVLQSPLSETSRNAITEYCSDDAVHSYFLVTYQELFSRVWNRIINNKHREELVRILDEQIQDAECKCMTGRFVRTMSVLVGFYDDIIIGISDNAQITAVIETARKTIVPYDAQCHADVVHQRLSEMGYNVDQISPWTDAILES